jgi:oligopeptide transport system permease protein
MARVMRASFISILKEDYLRTCYAKGLPLRSILFKHALKNAITPIVTFSGPLLAGLITGSFVIEYIFSIPGWENTL